MALDMYQYSTKALFSYKSVKDRSDYLVSRIKEKTFGDYTDQLGYLVPIATKRFEFDLLKCKVYFDAKDEKSGISYSYNF